MPQFYFHFRKGDEFIIDDEGLDLPVARELLADVSVASRDRRYQPLVDASLLLVTERKGNV